MMPQSNIRSEDAKKLCKTPESGDIATVNGETGWVVVRDEGTSRLPAMTFIETPDGEQYTAETDTADIVNRPAFRPAIEIAPECPVCRSRKLRIDWERVGEPSRLRQVPVIICDACKENGERRYSGLVDKSRVENVDVFPTEGVVRDA